MFKTIKTLFLLCCHFPLLLWAQEYSLGNHQHYFQQLSQLKRTVNTDSLTLKLGKKKELKIDVYSQKGNVLIGRTNQQGSLFLLRNQSDKTEGFLIQSDQEVYQYATNTKGELVIFTSDMNAVKCVAYQSELENHHPHSSNDIFTPPENAEWEPYELQSYPEATAVIYLDFNGHKLEAGTPWNNGAALNAAATGYSDNEILAAWGVVAEDYSPFKVNVTTNESVFLQAPTTLRTRVVFTPTSYWSQGGGVALVGSFNWTEDFVCWVFSDGFSSSVRAAEAGSHEAGHTLSLKHDGKDNKEYYAGHAGWAPIMGNSYSAALTQWSLGDYTGATRSGQDDVAIISENVTGTKADDHGNSITQASEINYTINGDVAMIEKNQNKGIISTRNDIDAFHFFIGGGEININIEPTGLPKPNLDLEVKLVNSTGQTILTKETGHSNFTEQLNIKTTLTKGDYYILIDGVGTGNPNTGWTDYASLGMYRLNGTISGIQQKDYDATIVSIQNLEKEDCGNFINPHIEIMNGGKIKLTSVQIELLLDNQSVYNQQISVDILSGESELIEIGNLAINEFGNKELLVKISNPNGKPDEVPVNDTKKLNFKIEAGQLFEFSISTTSLSDEMEWDIRNSGGVILQDNSVDKQIQSAMQIQHFCLAEDCYTFELRDAFLEDLCNQYPAWESGTIYNIGDQMVYKGRIYEAVASIWAANPIDYAHYYKDLGTCPEPSPTDYFVFENKSKDIEITHMTVSEYNQKEAEEFCVNEVISDQEAILSVNLFLYPNPITSLLHFSQPVKDVVIYSLQGQKLYQNSKTSSINLSNYVQGMYLIEYTYQNQKHQQKIIKD